MYSSSSESSGQLNALTRDASIIGQASTLRVAVAGKCSGAPFVLKCTEVRDEVKLQLDHAKVDPPASAPGCPLSHGRHREQWVVAGKDYIQT